MGSSSSYQLDPAIKDLSPEIGLEPEELIHSFYKGENLAKNYAAYRPQYPLDLFQHILKYHTEEVSNDRQLAVDVCCGPGQSSIPLVQHFTKVVGIDVSEDQIANMPKDIPNLTAHVALAEDMSMIESGTVDLVTIGTGLHWVNHVNFFEEVKRILNPSGSFAAYTLIMDQLDNEKADDYYRETARKVLQDKETRIEMKTTNEITVENIMGILQSIHIIQLYYTANPETNVLEEIQERMKDILKSDENSVFGVTVKMTKYYFLLLGRNKGDE